MRGEYAQHTPCNQQLPELPPRARRIQAANEHLIEPMGTTSACAENTYYNPRRRSKPRNYLRVRGEYVRRLERAEGVLNYLRVRGEYPK